MSPNIEVSVVFAGLVADEIEALEKPASSALRKYTWEGS